MPELRRLVGLSAVLSVALTTSACLRKKAEKDEGVRPSSQKVAVAAAEALGGALFSFDREKMRPWTCDSCPKPVHPQPRAVGSAPDSSRSESPYFVVRSAGETDRLPLKSTRADVSIAANVAEVRVTQIYENEGKNAIEAIYTFPASTRAAVHALRMTIGERTVEAKIRRSSEARREYEEAKSAGKTASLLEQKRPNVFTMSVGNILPGDRIRVEMIYNELLVPDDDVYEFVYPTVVGPRYLARDAEGDWQSAPRLEEGMEATYTFGLEAYIHSPVGVSCLGSETHHVRTYQATDDEVLVSLEESEEGGNRDFVLRYSLAGEGIESGALLYEGDEESFFMLMTSPPMELTQAQVVPREYLFILDVSGSMSGFPLNTSKEVMRSLLDGLRPGEYFNVLSFAASSAVLSPTPLPASSTNVDEAWEKIRHQVGGGGTELLAALNRALALPRVRDTHRVVVVLTDGFVHADREAIALIRDNLDNTSVFAFGIGTGVNRYLIEGLAHAGRGQPFIATHDGEAAVQAERFDRYVRSPVLHDVEVSYEGFDAYDVEPSHVPAVFSGRPLVVLGKYRGEAKGKIVLTGRTADGEVRHEIDVEELAAEEHNEALRTLWAREAVRRLDDLNPGISEGSGDGKRVTELGLEYGLLTRFTSFVAVDSQARATGEPQEVLQPVPLPEGVSNFATGQSSARKAYLAPGRLLRGAGAAPSTRELAASPALSKRVLDTADPLEGLGAPDGEGFGAGALGSGGGGTGRAYGRGGPVAGRGPAQAPNIQAGQVTVTGSLDTEVIRRVVRRHLNEVRACYDHELRGDPNLEGKIVLEFVIGGNGSVLSIKLLSSTLRGLRTEVLPACVQKVAKGWLFPKPARGTVTVKYPFDFRPK